MNKSDAVWFDAELGNCKFKDVRIKKRVIPVKLPSK